MPAPSSFPPSDHCDGRRFFNAREHINRSWRDVWKWRQTARPAAWPARVEVEPQVPPAPPAGTAACTFINHATFLFQTPAGNAITDPVFSRRAGPFGLLGPRRVHRPGVNFDDLPRIDWVLLSHDHYDHCDLATLRRLRRRFSPRAITPLGNGRLLRRAGFPDNAITELDWWETESTTAGLAVTVTPARHWSNRLSGPRNGRLWGGFVLRTDRHRLYFAGDTGYDAQYFAEVRSRHGAPDLAVLPIGAYEPRWFMASQHCDPAEAVQIHRDLGARRSIGMHWGTFQLTDEAREAPVIELGRARAAAGLEDDAFVTLAPGQTVFV